MSFTKAERSYFTPNGWRLATFEETNNGLEKIKEEGLLNKWDRVRLLDGWILGPGYDFQMGNDFRGCLGYMLLIEEQSGELRTSGSAYGDVNLNDFGKEVALFLCVDDWNFEVVYWVLNSCSKSETMDIPDVKEGKIPFPDTDKFTEMNRMLGSAARKLGLEGGAVCKKAAKRKYSGMDSVEDVLSGMIKFVKEDKNIVHIIGGYAERWMFKNNEFLASCFPESVEPTWLEDVAWNAIEESLWRFLSECFAGYVVEYSSLRGLRHILGEMNTKSTSEKNFAIATSVLLYLSDYRSDIIHAQLPHRCICNCTAKIVDYVAKVAAGNPEHIKDRLQSNPMWRSYDDTPGYHLLNKLLMVVAKGKYPKAGVFVADRLLGCGIPSGTCYPFGKCKKKTVLHYAAKSGDENFGIEIAKCLFHKCDENMRERLVNAVDYRGRTALHRASEMGNASICKLLLDNGAALSVQDQNRKTALHNANSIYNNIFLDNAVLNVFMENPSITDCLHIKDASGESPIDAILKTEFFPIGLLAKILSKSKQPENYFEQVNRHSLLRESLIQGYVNVVEKLSDNEAKLLEDVDDKGQTALHFTAMCQDQSKAQSMLKTISEKIEAKETRVTNQDRLRRTALHEAALCGHARLSKDLLKMNPSTINIKDRDGRNPFYDAVRAKRNELDVLETLFEGYSEKGLALDNVIDRIGQTPLHVAASLGKAEVVDFLLSKTQSTQETFIKRSDFLGKTALHMATTSGDSDTVQILLDNGAQPFRERDCDRKTALHYAVQAKSGEDGISLTNMLLDGCKSDQERLLFLWASAAGIGPADQNLTEDDPLQKHILEQKIDMREKVGSDNLLRTAASLGDLEMTKELLTRGCNLADILDTDWIKDLEDTEKRNVHNVSRQLDKIAEQGNDQPTASDNLGRLDYALGLAALFLNPYIKSPLAVGISGSWGMGKSSLMIQTEGILLAISAQLALLPSSKLSTSDSNLPGAKTWELSEKGKITYNEIKRQVDFLIKENGQNEDSLVDFLNIYEPKYHSVFKALAVMDSSDMFTTNGQGSQLKKVSESEGNLRVPAILSVRYNAWKYRNETEALAGLAVEITREMEGTMNLAQWISTCWRNTWNKNKYTIWIQIIYPCLLAIVLAFSLIWIVWVVLDRYKFKESVKTKYACLPAAIVIIGWILTRSVMGNLKPVSTQLMHYISFPDHSHKLGYQERVISDITFLKDEIGKKPFTAFVWLLNAVTLLWGVISLRYLTSLFSHSTSQPISTEIHKNPTASGTHLRIIVFVDDLDRCQEAVILQVLSAINLVLAVCEINVVVGMDKGLIEKAIISRYGDKKTKKSVKNSQELADKYLQKIIQLPIDLADPSEEESQRFLKGQLGVFQQQTRENVSQSESRVRDAGRSRESRVRDDDEGYGSLQGSTTEEVAIDMRNPTEIRSDDIGESSASSVDTHDTIANRGITTDDQAANKISKNTFILSIPIRQMLFMTYSEGEQDAFCYFENLATESRKLPREWKRLLIYHRLVWNIFSLSKEAKNIAGWQVQLISWLFICWEWQEIMNIVIEKWNNIGVLKTSHPERPPSLLMIVDNLIEDWEANNENKMIVTGNEAGDRAKYMIQFPDKEDGTSHKFRERETSSAKHEGKPVFETRNRQSRKWQELAEDKTVREDIGPDLAETSTEENIVKTVNDCESSKIANTDKSNYITKNQFEVLEKAIRKELDEFKKDLKEQVVQQKSRKNGKRDEEERSMLQNCTRLRSALYRYDVSMAGIQTFQRFRFYCMAGHLPWPLHKPENEEAWKTGHIHPSHFKA